MMTKNPGGHRDEPAARQKKAYTKPEIRQVSLRPEEAVLGNCKTSGGGAGPAGTCTQGGHCSTLGS
jgi:hypothetical protein